MRFLIVNADDFGAGHGVNRGIVEAYRHGIVTSTSLMVATPWSDDAVALAAGEPGLGVGLHVDLDTPAREHGAASARDASPEWCRLELRRQLARFRALMGRMPTHVDSHHNVHRDPRLQPCFVDVAREHDLPLREHSAARYVSRFYGRWDGASHPEQVSADSLVRMLDEEVGDGVTELACHPGYVDRGLRSDYTVEREVELRTLCEPSVARAVDERRIRLVGFGELAAVAQHAHAG